MALLSISLDRKTYANVWRAPKFLTDDLSSTLTLGIIITLFGILLTGAMAIRSGGAVLRFDARQLRYLKKAYKTLFVLTLIGYALWGGMALVQGVGLGDLVAVLDRQESAISNLKAKIRPVAGLTTLTQFGPVAVVLGFLLRKLRAGGRSYILIVLLSLSRGVFYAERLAIIEVIIPLILVAAITVDRRSRWRKIVPIAPVLIAPLVWAIFAISEYTRSWVYYQQTTDMPFAQWVTYRLLGYYTTSFNNSALFAQAHESTHAPAYYTVNAFWSAPGISSLTTHPGLNDIPASEWWPYVLERHSNPEFNNVGSFLTTYAEYGPILWGLFWLAFGLALGAIFTALSKGSLPALLAYSALFVAILELSRFIYPSLGRATPILIALIVIALTYPRAKDAYAARRKRKPRNEASFARVSAASAPVRDMRKW